MKDVLNKVKIYKSATKKSIVDITSSLIYFKEKPNGEKEYQGKIIISITEIEKKQYLQFFMSKELAKVVFNSFINGSFDYIFPDGAIEYGGSMKNGNIRARILKITKTPKNQLVFSIDEGVGEKEINGSIRMVKREHSVQSYIPFLEALKMSHEVLSFISQAELVSFLNNEPLFSRKTEYKLDYNSQQQMDIPSDYNKVQNDYQNENDYVIKIGPLKGTKIKEVDSQTLANIARRLREIDLNNHPEGAELLNEIKNELENRLK